MVVTVTLDGYIKRTPLETFRAQNRGGKGRAGMATKDEDAVTELFVTSTHTPVLFFSTARQGLSPEGLAPARRRRRNARGRPMVNLLPLAEGETISTVLPLPEDEAEWGKLHVMFATAKGTVRRNSMDAFANVPIDRQDRDAVRARDRDDRLIGVALLTEERRRAARHPQRQGDPLRRDRRARVPEPHLDRRARHARSRDGDEVISLSILHGFGASAEEREAYLRAAPWKDEERTEPTLSAERMAEFAAAEEFILTVCANGYGKRTSAYEYRRTGRGGQGITNIDNIDAQRPGRRQLPRASRRAADAGHRPGQADPHDRRRHARDRPQHAPACGCSTSPRTSMSSAPRGSRKATRKRATRPPDGGEAEA